MTIAGFVEYWWLLPLFLLLLCCVLGCGRCCRTVRRDRGRNRLEQPR